MAISLVKLGPEGTPLDAGSNVSELEKRSFNDFEYMIEPRRLDRSRLLRYGLIAAIALIWISLAAMGMIWWMNRGRSSSEPLDPKYQRMYVTVVAQRYWQTSNLARAQRDLVLWREEDLAQLLAAMQTETRDPETRKQLAVLAAALRLPEPQTPALSAFFTRETILIALLFPLIPLFVAIGIVAVPYLRTWNRRRDIAELPLEEASAAELEGLLPDVPVEEQTTAPKEEKKAEEKKPTEEADKEEEEQSGELGDLASLFEEEDVSLSALENFAKGMAEIVVDDLLKNCRDSVRQLLRMNAAHAKRSESH